MKSNLLMFVLSAAAAFGGTISFGTATNGTTVNATDITGFATSGDQMAGMLITGTFATGPAVVCTWGTTGAGAGGCTGATGANGFHLEMSGDTFFSTWSLNGISGSNLLSLLFNGLPGFTVFDRSVSPSTDGSASGTDIFGTTSLANVNGTGDYANRVATLGNAPVGDLFAQITLSFTDGGLSPGSTASLVMDTDNVGQRGGNPGSVPEPSTFALIGGGLLALGAFRKRHSA